MASWPILGPTMQSGKGRMRRFLFPTIRSRERCGHCSSCLNPGTDPCRPLQLSLLRSDAVVTNPAATSYYAGWKKACFTRRDEQVAQGQQTG